METLKIQVKKEIYSKIVSGEENTVSVDLTQNLAKRASVNGCDKETLENDKNLLKKFDELYISCMFSTDNTTRPIEDMKLDGSKLVFRLKQEKNVKTENENVTETKNNVKKEVEKKENKEEKRIEDRINEIIDNFCKNKDVFVVNTPRVIVKPNGFLFGLKKQLPINNDQSINIDIEKQSFLHTYDMTDDMFVSQFSNFLKSMLVNNYVFIWKNKCSYRVVDGKRFLNLYYTTRRHIKQKRI